MKNIKLITVLIVIVFLFTACNRKSNFLQHGTSLTINEAPWGVEFDALPPHIDNYPHQLLNIKAERVDSLIDFAVKLGIKWVRLSVNWSHIVDTAGIYNWDMTDRIINGLYNNKIEILLCINGGHKLYTKGMAPNTSEYIAHWKDFARNLVNRYKEKVNYWELWNEPNYISFWRPYPKAGEYVHLMKEFYSIVNELDPGSKIVGGSLARLDMPYADSILNLGIGQYINAFSYHPYGEFPEGITTDIKVSVKSPVWHIEPDNSVFKLKHKIDSINPEIRLWQAECGYPSQDNSSGWTGNGPWSPNIQAKWLLRRMMVDLSYNSEIVSYFCMAEYYSGRLLNSKGLLTIKDLSPKPAYFAYQNLISLLNGKLTGAESTGYNVDIKKFGSFYNIRKNNIKFVNICNDKNQQFMAYWIVWRMQDFVNKASMSIETDKPLKNPVLINLLTGEVLKIKFKSDNAVQTLLELPLADYPFIITEDVNVSYKSN